ncbi:DNA-binding protein [Paenibacillus sp. IHB B 3415]|uniref:helix-turn-helix domain-containing protein n=1 Tax=Paenibacillus sp. IHB B 3415 TaxID=867080 RepID=UPI0005748E9F|nr:helix-turn-helix domain-containing protein [Paenibacillus sp. IHB B 3415]KHL93596.1 DNA-binding protein [Paenibacillus sp. IHB B 3415]
MDTEAHLIINQQEIYALLFQSYPDVVNIAEMCEMLGGISSKTAYKLLQENQISHFKIGRTYKIPKVNILLYLNIFTFERPHYDALVH